MTAGKAARIGGLVLAAVVLPFAVAAAATPGKITKEVFAFGEQAVT